VLNCIQRFNLPTRLTKRIEIILVCAILLIIGAYITYQLTWNAPMYINYIRTEESNGDFFYIYGYYSKEYNKTRDLEREDIFYTESLRNDAKEFNWINSGYNDKNEMMPVFIEFHDDSTRIILNDEFENNDIHLFYSNIFYNSLENKNFTIHSFYVGPQDSIRFREHIIKRDSLLRSFGY